MKTALILFIVTMCYVSAVGQNRDNIWVLSYLTGPIPYSSFGIDFYSGVADTFSIPNKKLEMFVTDGSICDTLGHLLFYTNGLYIANRNDDTLLNSHLFNDGEISDFYNPGGMGISQGAIIIPKPDHPNNYLLFYQTGDFGDYYDKNYASLYLSMSEVNMSLDGGLGGISLDKKNIHLVNDTLIWGRITACKHANGRDWWLISHKAHSDLYYKWLIQSDTIIGPLQQHIGNVISIDKLGMACFSPDGSKYAHLSYGDSLDIFNFDRCTGEFSNHVFVPIPDSLSIGLAFSAGNQYLYVNQHTKLYQVDLFANDIPASLIQVGEYDGFKDPKAVNLSTWFFTPQLAPDNKIYLSTWNGTTFLHKIEHPDNEGLNCDFQQHSFQLPLWNLSVPNFPNYDLGPLDGSGCDTIYSPAKPSQYIASFKISPNPTTDWLNIVYSTSDDSLFELYDVNGKRVGFVMLYPYFKNRLLQVNNLPAGMYLGVVMHHGERVWSSKVVVTH